MLRTHRIADANSQREYEQVLRVLERTCDCGNDKMPLPDGSRAETCRTCHEMDEQRLQRDRGTGTRSRSGRRRDEQN